MEEIVVVNVGDNIEELEKAKSLKTNLGYEI